MPKLMQKKTIYRLQLHFENEAIKDVNFRAC